MSEAWLALIDGRTKATAEHAGRALAAATDGSDTWFRAAGLVGSTAPYSGRLDLARDAGDRLSARWARDGVSDARLAHAGARLVGSLISCGASHLCPELVRRFVELPADVPVPDAARMWLEQARAFIFVDAGDHAAAAQSFLAASTAMWAHGETTLAVAQRANAADELLKVGAWARAEAVARALEGEALPGRLALVLRQYAGLAAAFQGRLDAGIAEVDLALAAWDVALVRGQIRARLAQLAVAAGELDRAEALAESAVESLARHPPHLPGALATRSRVRRARGELAGAREDADVAWAALVETGHRLRRAPLVRLAFIDAVAADGDAARAGSLLVDARAALLSAAARISDEALRESFLAAVPEHAETLRRAAAAG
ncbi:MAG: hypothetical protein H6745_17870 [Deltaproteobacteria bacterium]|nr:hypothetical protein [Deltaproteobacteria bacterium]